jgi:hypothetical protein
MFDRARSAAFGFFLELGAYVSELGYAIAKLLLFLYGI